LAPSGGWPRAGRASKGPPKEGVPGFPPVPPWPVPVETREPVEGPREGEVVKDARPGFWVVPGPGP